MPLERELEGELHQARVVQGRVHRAKSGGVDIANRQSEMRVVEEVEELCPEIQAHAFPGQRESLDDGEVGVNEIRTHDRDTVRIPQLSGCCRLEAGWVNVLQFRLFPIHIAPSNLIRTVEVVSIAAAIEAGPKVADPGLVEAIDQRVGESR